MAMNSCFPQRQCSASEVFHTQCLWWDVAVGDGVVMVASVEGREGGRRW